MGQLTHRQMDLLAADQEFLHSLRRYALQCDEPRRQFYIRGDWLVL